jgi:hypothetical protein
MAAPLGRLRTPTPRSAFRRRSRSVRLPSSGSRPRTPGSLDPDVARSLDLPLRAVGIGFFVLLAAVAAEATQAVGALLLLGLLAAPGGAARLLTDNPGGVWRSRRRWRLPRCGAAWHSATRSLPCRPALR